MCTAKQLYITLLNRWLFLFGKLEDVEGVVVVHGNLGHVSPLLGVQAHDTRPQVPQHHKMYNYDQTKCLNPYNVNYQKKRRIKTVRV